VILAPGGNGRSRKRLWNSLTEEPENISEQLMVKYTNSYEYSKNEDD